MNLSLYMKHDFYLRGEVVRRKNESALAMFYVIKGHLEVTTNNNLPNCTSNSYFKELYNWEVILIMIDFKWGW